MYAAYTIACMTTDLSDFVSYLVLKYCCTKVHVSKIHAYYVSIYTLNVDTI